MSTDDGNGRAPPLFDFRAVLEASQRQVRENLRELEANSPLDRLRKRQEWRDLNRLRLGARRDDRLLEVLLGDLPERFRPSERERNEALERLTRRWARQWRRYDRNVQIAAIRVAEREESPLDEVKRQALQTGILLALRDAREPLVTRIGRDRAMSFGSRIRLLQKQDLEPLAENELSERLVKQLSRRPAGLRVFEPYQLLSPIEAVLRFGVDVEQVRPGELRPSLFQRWVRRRAIKHAENWLLKEAGLDDPAPHVDAREVKVIEDFAAEPDQPSRDSEQVPELDLLEALDRTHPNPLREIIVREKLGRLLEVGTPSQRDILKLLLDELAEGLSIPAAKKAVADQLGTSVNRIDVAFHNLRNKRDDPR